MLPPRKVRRSLWRVPPRAILFAIGAAVVGFFLVDRAWVKGNGLVAGELTAVSPIVQSRLEKLYVNCLDHVKRGQRLAEFRNEATVDTAAQQLLQLELELTQARAGIDIADRQAQVARKLVDSQAALLSEQKTILAAEDELMKQQHVAVLVWERAKAAVDRAQAELNASEFVFATKMADKRKSELDAEVLNKRIASFKNSPELTGHFYLAAPKDGIITQCNARPGEVIAARTAILSIFNPDEAYAVVFFSPSDISRLSPGQSFDVSIEGIAQPVSGTVTAFYPELSALPSSLTRYFWQQEKWSQYAPVRLKFERLTNAQSGKLFASAQLSASRWEGLSNPLATSASWKWVQNHLGNAGHSADSKLAEQ